MRRGGMGGERRGEERRGEEGAMKMTNCVTLQKKTADVQIPH